MSHGVRVVATLTLRDTRSVYTGGNDCTLGRRIEVLHPPGFEVTGEPHVIFVHGYNVHREEARFSYAQFRWWLEHFGVHARIIELHWPGDYGVERLRAGCYPWKIGTAKRGGALLAEWIAARPRGTRFVLVGHSLGCRLAMEAVKNLRSKGHLLRIESVHLMAAAVPVEAVRSNRLGPWPGEIGPPRWRVLYSRGDRVLRGCFKLGQAAALDYIGSEAIGLGGAPSERWRAAGSIVEMAQDSAVSVDGGFYDHSDYWRGGPEKQSDNVVRQSWREPLQAVPAPPRNRGESARVFAGLLHAAPPAALPVLPWPAAVKQPVRYLPY